MQQPPGQGQGQGQPPQGYGQPPAGYGQPPQQAQPPNPAQTPGIIVLALALVFAISLFTSSWATASEGGFEINAGLMELQGCAGDRCESEDWSKDIRDRLDLGGDVEAFRLIGMLSGVLALIAMCVVGGMALSRNTHKIPLKAIQGVMGVAAFSLTYFVIRLMLSDKDVSFSPGFSAFLGIGSLIASGIVMRQLLGKLLEGGPAVMPYGAAPPMQQQQPPTSQQQQPQASTCPTCGGALQYVAQYQRYYCAACQQYV